MTVQPSATEFLTSVARLRIAEAILAHARSMGISNLPADRMAQMTDTGVKLLEGLSLSELQNLSSASSQVMQAALTSFNQVYGQLSESQLRALKQGIDPTNIPAVQAFAAGLPAGMLLAGAMGAAALAGGRANYRGVLDGGDGVSPQKLANYASQYGDLGLGAATISLFAAVDLNRKSYDALAREGYSDAAIKGAAADTKALGWKGADAVADTAHAPDALRNAAIALVNARTDSDRANSEQELERIYDGLSPEDQAKAAPFLRRLNSTHHLDAERTPDLARAVSDEALAATRGASAEKAALDAVQRRTVAADQGQSQAAAEDHLLASLDVGPAPTPAKPTPAARAPRGPGASPN
jgi:hypothetical protein